MFRDLLAQANNVQKEQLHAQIKLALKILSAMTQMSLPLTIAQSLL